MDSIPFAIADAAVVRDAAEHKTDGIVLFKKFEEGRVEYDGPIDESSLKGTHFAVHLTQGTPRSTLLQRGFTRISCRSSPSSHKSQRTRSSEVRSRVTAFFSSQRSAYMNSSRLDRAFCSFRSLLTSTRLWHRSVRRRSSSRASCLSFSSTPISTMACALWSSSV